MKRIDGQKVLEEEKYVEAGSRVDWTERRFMMKRYAVFPRVAVLNPF